MGWVRQASAEERHACDLPTRGFTFHPAGQPCDLYRCDECKKLWRIGKACDICDAYGGHSGVRGSCQVGVKWRPATLGQRLKNWRKGR